MIPQFDEEKMKNGFRPLSDAPLLFFGGPYSNLEALAALLAQAQALGIPDCNLLCTGDVVAYCADPQAVVDELRRRSIAVVQGNCESSLGAGADDCGCGYETGSACDLLSVRWYQYARSSVEQEARWWMANLSPTLSFEWGGAHWLALHGGLHQNNRFLFRSDSDVAFESEIPDGVDVVVAGHCGLPFSRRLGNCLWHNAGVIGMPANDGTSRGWYTVAEVETGSIRLRSCPLVYDSVLAREKMHRADLPRGYADALLSGIWPSLDVLPEIERQATGIPLRSTEEIWTPRH